MSVRGVTGRVDCAVSDPEFVQVEGPLLRQLEGMGWTHLVGARRDIPKPVDPAASGRQSFAEVFLYERLRNAIHAINLGPDGTPWLDDQRISQAVGALDRLGVTDPVEANQKATALLLDGITVDGLPGWDGGREQRVHFIDWRHWDRNDFVVVSHLRLDIPGTQGKRCVVPDEVLFVNGIPLVVIECKKTGSDRAITEAVKQLKRYANSRGSRTPEGNAKLFHTVQLTLATSGEQARLGTFTGDAEHYMPWRDPYPLTPKSLGAMLGKEPTSVTAQDILAGVVFQPERLLDIVHNYVTFMPTDDGPIVKVAPRYQQYRAVEKAIDRLLTGETKPINGTADQRGGIIWHTQGSGKSLTMTFLVRKMRSIDDLGDTKVVVVTDRTQLQGQLNATMQLTGEKTDVAKSVRDAKALLGQHGPGIVFVMIQKQQDVRPSGGGLDDEHASSLGELNTDESIVVLIDEAHRSHGSTLHKNLLEALPNCARIGFTGTPIIMGKRKKTEDIFGPFIDEYKLKDAEKDGAVVPIFYEGHTVKGAVRDGRDLDDVFEDMFAEQTDEEREALQRRYATKGDVLEAEELIAAKARHMLRHYVGTVLPGGFKAQLVAHSREATVRYREALIKARDELVRQAEALPDHLRRVDPVEIENPRRALLVRAYRHLDRLRSIDFVPVISPGTDNDEERYTEWTDESKQRNRIKRFLKPFSADEGDRPIAFLIVKSMLLTGFDAPIEQVLYVDRSLKEAELLQAVARVNRTADRKKHGLVVDYFGVANHLQQALQAYADKDVKGTLKDLREEIDKLDPQRRRVRMLFTERGVTPASDEETVERCVLLLLDDPQLSDRFDAELKRFLSTVDTVLPDPAVSPYLPDARLFARIQVQTRRRRRTDGDFDPGLYGEKVRDLIDHHLVALGIEDTLPPVSLTASDFREKVEALGSSRAKASEMEHAIRHHLEVNFDRDPHRYKLLSQRLEEILREHKENWDQQVLALQGLLADLERDRPDKDDPLSPVERALYGVLLTETATDGVVDEATDRRLCDFVAKVHGLAIEVTHRRDFWRRRVDQVDFTKQIAEHLAIDDVCEIHQVESIADKLFEVVKANRANIPRP